MRKITFKGVLDNFRNSVAQPSSRPDQEIQETLRAEHFQVKRVSLYVFLINFKLYFLFLYAKVSGFCFFIFQVVSSCVRLHNLTVDHVSIQLRCNRYHVTLHTPYCTSYLFDLLSFKDNQLRMCLRNFHQKVVQVSERRRFHYFQVYFTLVPIIYYIILTVFIPPLVQRI